MRIKTTMQVGLLTLCLCIPALSQNSSDVIRSIFDMRGLKELFRGQALGSCELPLRSSIAQTRGDDTPALLFGEQLEDIPLPWEALSEVISYSLNQNAEEESDYGFDTPLEGIWCVSASQRQTTGVRRILKDLEDALSRTCVVAIHPLDGRALLEQAPGILTAEAAGKLVFKYAAGSPLRERLTLGQNGLLTAGHMHRFISDYDAEIAEKTSMADPMTHSLFEGIQVGLKVEETMDGRYQLTLTGRSCARAKMSRRARVNDQNGELELPVTSSMSLGTSMLLQEGEAVLLGGHSWGNRPWLIHLVSVSTASRSASSLPSEEKPAPGGRHLEFLPLGPILSRDEEPRIAPVLGLSPAVIPPEEDCEPEAFLDKDTLMELLSSLRGDLDKGAAIYDEEHWLMLYGAQKERQRIRQLIAHFTAPSLHNVHIEVRYGMLQDKEPRVQESPTGISDLAERLSRHAHLTCRIGHTGLVVTGREWLSVRDMAVEVASKSRIADPIVDALFAGMVIRATPLPSSRGHVAMKLDYSFQTVTKASRPIDTRLKELGLIDSEDLAFTHGRSRLRCRTGQWNLVRMAPLPKVGGTFAMVVRLTLD